MQRRGSFRCDSIRSIGTPPLQHISVSASASASLRDNSNNEHTRLLVSDKDTENNADNNNDDEQIIGLQNWYKEFILLLNLAIPSLVAQLGWSVPSTLISSYIGRNFGSIYLGGYMLVMLSCSLCTLSLLEGVFSAIDTKMPQAFGMKKYNELQYLCFRGIIVCIVFILIPFIIIMSLYMDKILILIGEDSTTSYAAIRWFRIYSFSLPFYSIFHISATFLGSQSILLPEVISVLINSLITLPLLLYTFGYYYGYIGTAYAMTLYEACQMIFLLSMCYYYPQHHPQTFPLPITFKSIQQSIKKKPMMRFISLSAGGILSTSDWIYWELISIMIGTMGVTQLSVHTIPTQISSILYMIHLGIAIALSIRIGNMIVQSPHDAKKLSFYTTIISSLFFAVLSYYVYIYRFTIYSMFTTDSNVINGCEEIWILVTIFTFNMGLFTIVDGIVQGLGKQWIVGQLTVVYLFLIGLPCFCYFGIYKNGGVYAAWQAMLYPNIALTLSTILYLCTVDWEQISIDIKNEDDDSADSDKYTDDEDSSISDDNDDDQEAYDNDITKYNSNNNRGIHNHDDVVDDDEEITGNSHTLMNGHNSNHTQQQQQQQQHEIKTINITTTPQSNYYNNNTTNNETIPLTTSTSINNSNSYDDTNNDEYAKYYGSTTNGYHHNQQVKDTTINNGSTTRSTGNRKNTKSTTQQQKKFFGLF